MSDVFKSNPPILLLELEEVANEVGPVLVNMENVLHHQVVEGEGTFLTFIGGDVLHVKEELTAAWLRDNT
jgi:hypothetical protein